MGRLQRQREATEEEDRREDRVDRAREPDRAEERAHGGGREERDEHRREAARTGRNEGSDDLPRLALMLDVAAERAEKIVALALVLHRGLEERDPEAVDEAHGGSAPLVRLDVRLRDRRERDLCILRLDRGLRDPNRLRLRPVQRLLLRRTEARADERGAEREEDDPEAPRVVERHPEE